jgi:hypothetical protein
MVQQYCNCRARLLELYNAKAYCDTITRRPQYMYIIYYSCRALQYCTLRNVIPIIMNTAVLIAMKPGDMSYSYLHLRVCTV